MVLIAIQDDGSKKMSTAGYDALEKVGAQDLLRGSYRSSYALLGWSGPGAPDFVTQVGLCSGIHLPYICQSSSLCLENITWMHIDLQKRDTSGCNDLIFHDFKASRG